MRFTLSTAVITAYFMLGAQLATSDIAYNTTIHVDCYSQIPGYKSNGTWTYQSDGYCQHACVDQGYPVMALFDGDVCYCGDELPPNSTKTTGCDVKCSGFPSATCGGTSVYDVFLTGMTSSVAIMGQDAVTTTSAGGVTVITQAGQTIVVTASSGASASASSGSSGVSTAGIAAGVVVGVVGLSAIVGAAFFFMRRRRVKQLEEEYRRNAEINAFAQKKPVTPNSDSRWDGDYMAQRRQSNGSIADDQDFSRRILQVTNPDGREY